MVKKKKKPFDNCAKWQKRMVHLLCELMRQKMMKMMRQKMMKMKWGLELIAIAGGKEEHEE